MRLDTGKGRYWCNRRDPGPDLGNNGDHSRAHAREKQDQKL